jgi:hypothetical protein
MAAASTLSGPVFQASRAALSAALSDQRSLDATKKQDSPEPGEIQEVDMQAQAETIRTVFNDPKNFNVKVSLPLSASTSISDALPAPAILSLDVVVRFSHD